MNNKLTWQAVGVLAIVALAIVLLAIFSTWGSGEILAAAGILLGVGGGGLVGGAVAGRVEDLHNATDAQTVTLNTVAKRVNGDLDSRIASAMEEAAETGGALVIKELRRQGILK